MSIYSLVPVVAVAVFACAPAFADSAIGNDELNELRGGSFVINEQDLQAEMNGNTLVGPVSSGANVIGDRSVVGNNGLTTIIQNSGNQVVIQNSTIVNVSIR